MTDTKNIDLAISSRLSYYSDVSDENWYDWKWQQKHSVRSYQALQDVFPAIKSFKYQHDNWSAKNLRITLSPYLLALINRHEPLSQGPIFRQFLPYFDNFDNIELESEDEYSPNNENWECDSEMLTDICQWKYDNRVIIYSIDACFAYCTYCLRSLQSNDEIERHGGYSLWDKTMQAIAGHPEIEEVIISGGDPLMYSNDKLEYMLSSIRSIPTVRAISINTRALTHNPYRIDQELVQMLKKYNVTKLGVHVNHSAEITRDFIDAVKAIQAHSGSTLLLGQTVLLKNVNDSSNVLRDLFMDLYVLGIKPGYLFHNMPNIPSARQQRTSVEAGVRLINSLKRRISNPAMPEYIIAHRSGKKTVPLELNGNTEFKYSINKNGHPVVLFKNWKNETVQYLNGIE